MCFFPFFLSKNVSAPVRERERKERQRRGVYVHLLGDVNEIKRAILSVSSLTLEQKDGLFTEDFD